MQRPTFLIRAAGFLGNVGKQASVSVVASAAAAACLALPSLLSSPDPAPVPEPAGWQASIRPDGKISERHRSGDEPVAVSAHALLTPASIVMPMSLAWALPTAEPKPVVAEAAREAEPAPVRVAHAPPPRRPSGLAEKPRPALEVAPPSAAPLQLVGAVADGGDRSAPRPPAAILGRPVPRPVGYVTAAVSEAAGMVGAAGSWTAARAASLVPGL